jgi:NAD(P)-dependent dehydrogenase (short-subunit alcohol dehydrogenase family)
MNTGRRIAWVTGAGKGIGRALALELAEAGWIVAASTRSGTDLVTLETECVSDRIHGYPLDVTDEMLTSATVDLIEKKLGPIDLAILNAGTHLPVSADRFRTQDIRQLVETNIMGTANCLAVIMPKLIERRGGRIAVMASLAGYRGLPTAAGYGATKAALIAMCEALSPELCRHGVRLSVINPGFVKTPLTDRNDFPMPFLITAEEAAKRIMWGLDNDAFEISFPFRFALLMKVLRILPDRLFFALTRRMIPE